MKRDIQYTITEDMLPSLQGVIPSSIATCASDGIPNGSGVSQVYYVDETHVAISNQFLNKTVKNLQENPIACVIITCPVNIVMRKLMLSFVESQTTGEVFEKMKMQLAVIAGRQRMEDVFFLRSADVFRVLSVETL
jgi:predicted pyridoxine 5'-phosphate oxidase superfamily flavin-nucleotide-binding protein